MNGKFFSKVIVAAVLFGVISSGIWVGVNRISQVVFPQKTEEKSQKTLTTSEGIVDSTAVSTATTVTDVSDLAKNVMPSIVQVTNMSVIEYRGFFGQRYEQEGEDAGSGVIISQDDEYIYVATNNHVVENSKSLTITFSDDNAVSAELQGTYPRADLAVVKVSVKEIGEDTLKAIKVATVGDSDKVIVGESAVVIGNALGYGQSVTTGVVSALDREVEIQNSDGGTYTYNLIQTDAAVNPGNSGGALFNIKGELVGIVSAKYSDTSVEGMGYAIPITTASSIIDDLMNYGEVKEDTIKSTYENEANSNAYLGIYGVDVDEKLAFEYDMPEGIYVGKVEKDSGADKAGIKKGDVIVGFGSKPVSSMEQLQEALKSYKPGDEVEISVAKATNSYSWETVNVVLGQKTDSEE